MDLLSDSQLRAIWIVGREYGWTEAGIRRLCTQRYRRYPQDLSRYEAGMVIEALKRDKDAAR